MRCVVCICCTLKYMHCMRNDCLCDCTILSPLVTILGSLGSSLHSILFYITLRHTHTRTHTYTHTHSCNITIRLCYTPLHEYNPVLLLLLSLLLLGAVCSHSHHTMNDTPNGCWHEQTTISTRIG